MGGASCTHEVGVNHSCDLLSVLYLCWHISTYAQKKVQTN